MILLMILPTVSLFELIAEMCVIELKFFFLAALWHMEYPGQESDPSCSCRPATAATSDPLLTVSGPRN